MTTSKTGLDRPLVKIPKLDCMMEGETAPRLVPASAEREWMDATPDRFAYRCTPLSIANASGWELLAPTSFSVIWTGFDSANDVIIRMDDPNESGSFVTSIFGSGIVTFLPGYIFRTDPGWFVWTRGSPNRLKDGIVPLDGIVETNWLPFGFTMNWKFTRPGRVHFEKDEPFCFITLTPSVALENVQPTIRPLSSDPEFHREYLHWASERAKFNYGLSVNDQLTIEQKWQKYYLKGTSPTGASSADSDHRVKRKLKTPSGEASKE